MLAEDEKKAVKIAEQLIELMSKIYEAQKILHCLEQESDELLRKLLSRRNGKD